MGVMNNVDDALAKSAAAEILYFAANNKAEKVKAKKRANLYFRQAMLLDGHEFKGQDIIT